MGALLSRTPNTHSTVSEVAKLVPAERGSLTHLPKRTSNKSVPEDSATPTVAGDPALAPSSLCKVDEVKSSQAPLIPCPEVLLRVKLSAVLLM